MDISFEILWCDVFAADIGYHLCYYSHIGYIDPKGTRSFAEAGVNHNYCRRRIYR